MIRSGQHIAVENVRRNPLQRLLAEESEPLDEGFKLPGDVCHQGHAQLRIGSVELAVEGSKRSGHLFLAPQKTSPYRTHQAAGDIEHDLDQMRDRDVAIVLRDSMLLK